MSPLACHECDTLQRLPPIPRGGVARCLRCGARLCAHPRGGLDTPLALVLGALVLYLIANNYPLLELTLQGQVQAVSLSGAALALRQADMAALGLLVWITSVLIPGLVIGSTLYVLVAIRFSWRLPLRRSLLTLLSRMQPWGMLDVFMLGILVSLVKLANMAEIVLGPGLYAFVPLILFIAGATATLEPRFLWDSLEEASS